MKRTRMINVIVFGTTAGLSACDESAIVADDPFASTTSDAGSDGELENLEPIEQDANVPESEHQFLPGDGEVLVLPSDPLAITACGGPVIHNHGGDLFPATYQVTMGCDCAPGQTRDFFESFNSGNGSCSPIGWESPRPDDCRVRMEINRSGGFLGGQCNLIVEQGPAGDCFSPNPTTGCEDPDLSECVCNADPYCCMNTWDALCASEVVSLGCAPPPVADPAPCCDAHGDQGCSNTAVATCVCDADSYCCNTAWDSICAGEVTSLGCGTCPTEPSGDCGSAHAGGGCSNFSIAECVCNADPYCCNTSWDGICVGEVASLGCA